MALSTKLQARYLAASWPEIVSRLVEGAIVKKHPVHPSSPAYVELLGHLLHARVFVPAGNTLTFGASKLTSNVAAALRPNCSVYNTISLEDAGQLWSKGIGVGTTVLNKDEHPVTRLKALQSKWSTMTLHHRPMRGNMFVYPASGPHVFEFVNAKSTTNEADALCAFNISLGVDSETPLDSKLLDAVAFAAWRTGDPGIVFLDRVNKRMPLVHRTKTIQTLVPCGEQGMFDGEVCTLGAINLNAAALSNTPHGPIDMSRLDEAVRAAVTFLDNAVDVCSEVSGSLNYRRIGLGVMGWADYLARLRIDYASSSATTLARTLSVYIGAVARDQSCRLATLRGPFPRVADFDVNTQLAAQDDAVLGTMRRCGLGSGMRNVSVTCIPPTGGITLLTDNRGFAIEPFFYHATRIPWQAHISMAAAWQTGMCNSVSKTVNLAEDATVDDVKRVIQAAYATPFIKALSVYRANSRSAQPIAT